MIDDLELLTIDPVKTRARILAAWGSLSEYADNRPYKYVSIQRLLSVGLGPRSATRVDCRYQSILRMMKKDGFLVETAPVKEAA